MRNDNGIKLEVNDAFNVRESDIGLKSIEVSDNKVVFTKKRKYFILFLVSMASVLAPLGSTIYFPTHEKIISDLNTTNSLFDISISVFMFILAFFPLLWGDIADRFGRKGPLVISLILSLFSYMAGALANNMGILILFRILSAIGSAAPLVTGVGTLTDIFSKREIGSAMALFYIGFLLGPVIGPILGGILDDFFGWRSTFWFMSLFCGINLILVLVFIPETLPLTSKQPYPLTCNSKLQFRRTGPFFNPFKPLMYIRFPVIFIASIIYSAPFSAFFGIESFHSRAMKSIYNLNSSLAGVSFIVLGLGSIIGNAVGGFISDYQYKKNIKANSKQQRQESSPNPELRLEGTWPCILVLITGLLMYGWFLYYKFALAYTLVATFLIGFGYAASSIGCSTYFVELTPNAASSITGSAIFVRMILASIVTSINTIVMDKLNYGWGCTLYAGLAGTGIPLVLFLVWRGKWLRVKTGPPSSLLT